MNRGSGLLNPTILRVFVMLGVFYFWGVAGFVDPLSIAYGQRDLAEFREIERKVQTVVSQNMEACVSVSDFQGSGSGVIVSPDGLVLTAAHVIAGKKNEFEIRFPSGRLMTAVKLGMNLNVDAGMLQIVDGSNLPYVRQAENLPNVGDWVVALGHSGGFELGRKPPVRTGRFLKRREGYQLVTDAALIGGDSGGPLFNLAGELIGINSSIGGVISENRHVRIDIFRRCWNRLKSGDRWGQLPELERKKKGRLPAKRPMLGVTVDTEKNNGLVLGVKERSPAEQAGIQVGDLIIGFDGERVSSSRQLIEMVKKKRVGQQCPIRVKRNGVELTLQLKMRVLD